MSAEQFVSVVKVALSLFAICAVLVGLTYSQFRSLFAAEFDDGPDPLEASQWLRACPEGGGLPAERFRHPGDAMAFVQRLYRYGAVTVRVAGVRDGRRAGGLMIELPERGVDRLVLFAMVAEEAQAAGLPPELDTGQSYLRLWWDE